MVNTAVVIVSALGPDWIQPDVILRRFGGAALVAVLVILFIECGLFIFFLPGDSLLFVTGLFIATGVISTPLWLAVVLMCVAAIGGNVAGYWLGVRIGPRLLDRPNARVLKPKYFAQASAFLERHGARSVMLARFVPIVRTFITAVAGVVRMEWATYARYSAIGGVLWVIILTGAGFLIGDHVPWVGKNIELIAIGIVAVSVIPIALEWRRSRTPAAGFGDA